MEREKDKCVDEICDIWNHYIYRNKFFHSLINFRDNKGTNYFGDIIKYLSDTNVIIEIDQVAKDDFYNNFSNAISFLQAIYVQQDLIEELLYIFSCKSNKGTLKNDSNYSINRQIRNELVGHPIRKTVEESSSKLKLLSSTIFSNKQNLSNIAYVRYHKSNSFNSEHLEFSRADIKDRHQTFLNTYLYEIKVKAHKLLSKYKPKLTELLEISKSAPFKSLIKCVENTLESFLDHDYSYDPQTLLTIFERRQEHIRYEVVIDSFFYELRLSIKERIMEINRILKIDENVIPESKESYFSNNLKKYCEGNGFSYELSKLVDKDEFSIGLLKKRCGQIPEVLKEIEFLELCIDNDLEYYASYRYLSSILKRNSYA